MAGWQEELAELLHKLGVTQEEPQTNPRSTPKPVRKDARWHVHPSKLTRNLADISLSNTTESDDVETWPMDLGTMRREVDAIVRQVAQLTQRGELDQSAKEDILEVLHALRKFSAIVQQVAGKFQMPVTRIKCITHYMGGGYGSKFNPGVEGETAIELARKAGAPVKLFLDRADEIVTGGDADLVFLARELLREPYWALNAQKELGAEASWPISYGYAVKRRAR